MEILLAPGIGVLNRLRYPVKFLLICLVFLVPLVILGYQVTREVQQKLAFLAKERLGIEYLAAVRQPIQLLQQHRGMSAAYLNGDATFRDKMLAKEQAIDRQFAALQAADEKLGDALRTQGAVADLRNDWQSLQASVTGLTPAASFTAHTALVDKLIELGNRVADTSNLILDPELDSYYLMDLAVARLPALTEAMGQSRAIGAAVAAHGSFTQQSWAQLAIRLDRITQADKALGSDMATVLRENPALTSRLKSAADDADQAIAGYSQLLTDLLASDQVRIGAPEIYAKSTRAIDAVFTLYDTTIPTLDGVIGDRIDRYRGIRTTTVTVMVLVLLAMLYIFSAFYLAVLRSINDLKHSIQRLAAGDLTVALSLQTRDELRHVGEQLNAMTGRFRELVGRVVASTQHVTTAAEELSAVTEQTNQAINEQLSQTDQVATAVNQMSATVQEVARSAASTSEATRSAQQEAQQGHAVVTDTVACINDLAGEIRNAAGAVRQLGEDSQAIGAVLEVIRTIAEQTNLLALNAAIEAARAGEQGRGFAVVADEVRTLAGRTQQSTREIQVMIERLQNGARQAVQAMEASEVKTEEGVNKAARASEALTAITGSVATIAEMSMQIAAAAEQQTAVAEEINRNVTQIAGVADQNAAASNQTASSSNELARLAEELQGMVAVFSV